MDFRECYMIAWVEWNADGVSEFREEVIGEVLDVLQYAPADSVVAGIARRMIEGGIR